MLTLFTTAKAFHGHTGIIQRNALKSWKLLQPGVEVILFGDEDGAAEVCAELGLRHEAHVERHQSGMKYLDYIFGRAQAIARHNFLCYSNCDIVLMDDFWKAFTRTAAWKKHFLLIGQRWGTGVTEPIPFDSPAWAEHLRQLATSTGLKQEFKCVDYFAFSKGLYAEIPPLVNGRSYWDHWLVWKALASGVPVVDCTPSVVAVHQNHNYGYHPGGKLGTHDDPLAMRNLELSGQGRHQRTIVHATYLLLPSGKFRRTWRRRFAASSTGEMLWKIFVRNTFWLRRRLGIRKNTLSKIWKTRAKTL